MLQLHTMSMPTARANGRESSYEFTKLRQDSDDVLLESVTEETADKVKSKLRSAVIAHKKRNPSDTAKYVVREVKTEEGLFIGVWSRTPKQ